jgi:hypothetical protein
MAPFRWLMMLTLAFSLSCGEADDTGILPEDSDADTDVDADTDADADSDADSDACLNDLAPHTRVYA